MAAVSQITIARRLGVSQRAVSKALRGEAGVSAELRERVRTLARELGYRPNHLARALLAGESRLVGVLGPMFSGSFYGRILDGLQASLFLAGYRTLFAQWDRTAPADDAILSTFIGHRVEGLIITPRVPAAWKSSAYEGLRREGASTVLLDQVSPFPEFSSVTTDDRLGMQAVVRYLVELGHREIAYISPVQDTPPGRNTHNNRRDAFFQAAYAAGLSETGVLELAPKTDHGVPGALATLLRERPGVTALACFSDFVALAVLKTLQELGLDVPGRLSVTGYGDAIDYHEHMRVPLTTVGQRPYLQGKRAGELVVRMREGGSPEQLVLRPNLLVRSSTAPAAINQGGLP